MSHVFFADRHFRDEISPLLKWSYQQCLVFYLTADSRMGGLTLFHEEFSVGAFLFFSLHVSVGHIGGCLLLSYIGLVP